MTTAARLAAYFQLRSSNILIAPLDAPGVHPGCYLVVYRAGPRAELLGRDTLITLPTQQHDLVSDLDRAVHLEDAGIHRDPTQERPALAPDEGLGPSRERPPVPLSVPDRHRRSERCRAGPEGQSVGYPIARLKPPHVGDIALENHRGPEPLVARSPLVASRVEAVEGNARAHAVVMGAPVPQDASRVRSVDQRATERVRGQDLVEGGDLAPRLPLVAVRRGQVGVDALKLGAQDPARLPHLRRLDAPAVHPGVHLQMRLEAGTGGHTASARKRVGRDDEPVLLGEPEPVRQEVGEDEYGNPYLGASQFGALLGGHDGQSVRPGLERHAGDRDRAVAVGVGLHDGHEASAGGSMFEGADVVANGAKIYLGPGTAGGAHARGRAAQRSLPAGGQDGGGE